MTEFNSKERNEKLAIAVHVLQNTYDFVISSCCFAEEGEEMNKDSKRTSRTIVLLTEPTFLVAFLLASPYWFAKTP